MLVETMDCTDVSMIQRSEELGFPLETGEAIKTGSFTLDQDAASDKLEAFTHADRDTYLIALLEGLFALGAERIETAPELRGRGRITPHPTVHGLLEQLGEGLVERVRRLNGGCKRHRVLKVRGKREIE